MNEHKEYYTEYKNGQRHMECKVCGVVEPVSTEATGYTCHQCVNESYNKQFPMEMSIGYKPSGKPRGWRFMKQFVDKDGNVYRRGVEHPELKGKLKPTVIKKKPPKPKITKAQKAQQRTELLTQLHKLKKQLSKAKYKKDIRKITSQIKKIQRQVQK